MTKQNSKTIGINVGAELGAVKAAQEGILKILQVPHVDNATRVAALDAFKTICGVNGAVVSNCTIQIGEP